MINHNTNKHTTNPTSQLVQLISTMSGNKYGRYLKVIASNQGIATDGLSKFIKSNNHHNSSQCLNETLIPLGWVIAKFPVDSPSKSWRWYLMPITKALKLGIDARLKRKIFRLMEAANDE